MNEKIVTIQRGRGSWQGPESKAPRAPVMCTLPTGTTANASDTPVMCNDAAQLAALAEVGIPTSGDLISRDAAIKLCETMGVLGGEVKNPYACWRTHADNLAAAIRALPAQPAPAVKVRPLVWVDRDDIAGLYDALGADGWFYNVWKEDDGVFTYSGHPSDVNSIRVTCDTLEAAQTAAQADYEARILSAFEVAE